MLTYIEEIKDFFSFFQGNFFQDDYRKSWFNSFIIFIFSCVLFFLSVLFVKLSSQETSIGYIFGILACMLILMYLFCGIRGLFGMVFFAFPAITTFFPYRVNVKGWAFTHASANYATGGVDIIGHSGSRIYDQKHFLTRSGLDKFLANQSPANTITWSKNTYPVSVSVFDSSLD